MWGYNNVYIEKMINATKKSVKAKVSIKANPKVAYEKRESSISGA